MPLYFFDIDDGENLVRDEIGVTLDKIDDVENEAIGLLRDLVHLKMPVGKRIMTASVRGVDGITVYRGLVTVAGKRY